MLHSHTLYGTAPSEDTGLAAVMQMGESLLNLCNSHDLVITNTVLQQSNRYKTSWRHPRSKHWHLLDYVIVRRRDIRNVNVTRAMIAADDCWTDHHLIRCVMRLQIAPYNSRGFNSAKQMYITHLLLSCDILYVQEHWLSQDQLAMLNNLSPMHLMTGVSGFGNKEVLSGRPYGGCSIYWRRDLNLTVTQLSTTSRRISALLLSGSDLKMLCINVYMPCESDGDNFDEFSFQLSVVCELISKHSDCHLVLGGDLNVDFA